jgi:hypothetical protein
LALSVRVSQVSGTSGRARWNVLRSLRRGRGNRYRHPTGKPMAARREVLGWTAAGVGMMASSLAGEVSSDPARSNTHWHVAIASRCSTADALTARCNRLLDDSLSSPSAMRASGPAARPAHASAQFIDPDLDAAFPSLFFLGRCDPADPLVCAPCRSQVFVV